MLKNHSKFKFRPIKKQYIFQNFHWFLQSDKAKKITFKLGSSVTYLLVKHFFILFQPHFQQTRFFFNKSQPCSLFEDNFGQTNDPAPGHEGHYVNTLGKFLTMSMEFDKNF